MTDFLGLPPTQITGQLSNAQVSASAKALHNAQNDDSKIREAAEGFEAVFLGQMFKHMFPEDQGEGFFGGGNGEKIFHSLLVDEFAKITAKTGGIGIADAVMKQLVVAQEGKDDGFGRQNSLNNTRYARDDRHYDRRGEGAEIR